MAKSFGGKKAAPFAPGGKRDPKHPNDAYGNKKSPKMDKSK